MKNNKKEHPEMHEAEKVVEAYRKASLSNESTDVLGSWTGVTKDGDKPVQDADDL